VIWTAPGKKVQALLSTAEMTRVTRSFYERFWPRH
jgi:hypothetical protein